MSAEHLQLLAGSISSLIFMSATFPMLYKAWRTRDMESYSLSSLLLNNAGNGIHWLYIASLPFGPLWLLHGFYTLSTVFMLVWYLLYRRRPAAHPAVKPRANSAPVEATITLRQLTSQEMARV